MSLSVLVVDDDATTRTIFEMALSQHQYEVVTMNDGESALNYLEKWGFVPDVIVLDIFLPGKNGYEMLPYLRPLIGSKKVVATTSHYTSGSENEMLERGFDGVLLKPLDAQNIAAYLDNIAS